ncbi:TyrR family transcriptional regulator [Leminorella grimontii]|uniref:HTH-type transcriptional regulatory protein TyrR n=1 Tax=Leminorella grimontii TaxID=82981 RepID=A0AAV5MXW0_9GAMM|nr:transcriptional regulator TyrR [Leminorella grimontii]KFC96127.1 TyrR family transcriptional repressor [Leminorella grimontii ATCC 33999 = DSM 5078]GKX54688.1 TyrR family transcriptional regulator [Leminorella grimontii]GKX58110.1 TyrR family transcriptional regulator [Leminorella grimontii]VFS58647.1 Transcriptional regulatory protein tyrR [Leminorella grimontii]
MRLEVLCEDRLGLTRELLDLLVERHLDLRGIELDLSGKIYLNFSSIDFDVFSALMVSIRRIKGVIDVRTVSYMPSEQRLRALKALFESLPEPVMSIDLKGRIDLVNSAALALFGVTEDKIVAQPASVLVNGYPFLRHLEGESITPHSERVIVRGQDYLMDIMPIYQSDEGSAEKTVTGAVVVLKSAVKIGRQLQNKNVADNQAFSHIVSVSGKMKTLIEQANRLAMLDAPLLIVGDTGTGKDVLAQACHMRSARRDKPFLALSCASLPDDVVESELYGHAGSAQQEAKKGFFEQANGGTVLLDNISEMSPKMQSKLLRFLNDGTFRRVGEDKEVHVDVRVICATQKSLFNLVSQGVFREDLYYRLNVLTLTLPPLRERVPDIMPLAEQFITLFADQLGITKPRLSPDITPLLTQYGWPGNVRQLKNVLYRAVTQMEGSELQAKDIVLPEVTAEMMLNNDIMDGSLDEICKRFECAVLTQLYGSYPSTRKLAKRLGVSHTAIANKLREYGLSQQAKAESE